MVKAVNKLMRIVDRVVTALLGLMVFMVFIQILWRYVFKDPLSWTDQMCRFTLLWSVMLGIPAMFNRHGAIAFDFIFEKTKGKVRKTLEFLICIFGIFFAAVFFICGLDYVIQSGSLTVPGFPWLKYSFLYVSEVVGAALLFIEMIKQLVEVTRKNEIRRIDG